MIPKEVGYKILELLKEKGILNTKETNLFYKNYKEVEYIYKDEETMLKHRKEMEECGYKVYDCNSKTWFSGDEITKPNSSIFHKYDVEIITVVYGIRINGLIK